LYARKGLAVRAKRGRYILGESVRRIHHHASEAAAGRSGNDLAAARTRLALAQTEAQTLKNATLRGEMLPRDLVAQTWGRIAVGVRQRMLSWPSKAAFLIPALTAHDRALLDQMTRDDLEDASLGRGFDFTGPATAGDQVEGDHA
jgi:phage terminase Nu1 subunit (DNA packaging protein)